MSIQAKLSALKVAPSHLLCENRSVHIIILLVIYLSVSLFLAYQTQGFPYFGEDEFERLGEGGYERHAEHYSAYLHGYNLLNYDFFKSYGLIDESTASDASSHPYVYIHGSSLAPRLFTFTLLWLGIDSIYHQTLIFVILSSVWVPLAYLALTRLFNSYIAFFTTLFIATDYYSILTASVTLYRGWHMVTFFYLLWASTCLDLKQRRYSQYFHLGLATFLVVSFELPFAALSLLIATYIIFVNSRSLIKTIIILAIPTILTGALIATQATLYLGGLNEVVSHTFSTFLYRLNLSDGSDDAEEFFESRQIIFWPNATDPIGTVANFIPKAVSRFTDKYGPWLASFVLFSNLFVFYWYFFVYRNKKSSLPLSKTEIDLPKSNFNPAHFLLFTLSAILFVTLVFPSVLDFYNRRSLPLIVFFIFISVPFFFYYLQQRFELVSSWWIIIFLVFWFTAQLQVYFSSAPSIDGVQQLLQNRYQNASIGVTVRSYPWQALWYGIKTDAFYFEVDYDQFQVASSQQLDHPSDIFSYHPTFKYHLNQPELPEYILIDTALWPGESLEKQVLALPGVTVDAEYDRFMILKLSDRSISKR